MNVLLDRLDPFYVVRLFGKKGIKHRLAVSGRVKPPLDANFLHELVKTEGTADDADRTDDGKLIADDLVGRTGQHIAARRTDILDECQHRKLLFLGELADPLEDQMRL